MSFTRKLGPAAYTLMGMAAGCGLLLIPRGSASAAVGDLLALVLLATASVAFWRNAFLHPQSRAFWLLLSVGSALWAINTGFWTYYEVVLHAQLPDPCLGDVILFTHVIPFMAAVALRPHRSRTDRKVLLDAINFMMLLAWWIFLYAFVVFPDQYVSLNVSVYSRNYDVLYTFENLVLVLILGMVASRTQGEWRRVYWNLFVAASLYTVASELMNVAIAHKLYYSGSIYDLPFLGALGWMIWAGVSAGRADLEPSGDPEPARGWVTIAPRLATLAILSLPLLGLWTLYWSHGSPQLRNFRLLATMAAVFVLGMFVFLKQFLLDRQLIRLLDESRRSYENLQRLQGHLVQKEKLASLGQLVAGAAHEINNPLAAILGYSELLASQPALRGEQAAMAQKIGQQARRTRDLVADLLSFSQSPSEKALVDVGALVQRALQMHDVQIKGKNIRVQSVLEPGLPRIWGNSNQLLQTFLHLSENAFDALTDVGGGALLVTARHLGSEVVVEFSDSGPGMADPERVFDPFYTTKPVGKGTGLGLSAAYGVVQEHQGVISCRNNPEGGAIFTLRFPAVVQAAAAVQSSQG